MIKLINEGKALDVRLVDEKTLASLNADRLRILKKLEEPHYAAEISRALRMHPQTVYYHLRILASEKLIELKTIEEKQGSVVKKYAATAQSLALPLSEWKPYAEIRKKTPAFLKAFVQNGFFDAKIVVGSPEPHGKYRARGSEFSAIELSAFLATHAAFEYPFYYLDTESAPVRNQNLVLVGGPKVNMLTAEANASLPIRFTPSFEIFSDATKKRYGEDVGFVVTANSPFAPGKKLLVLAGASHHATRVAVLALLKKNWSGEENLAHVVQGYDEDGDGIVDAVEVLE